MRLAIRLIPPRGGGGSMTVAKPSQPGSMRLATRQVQLRLTREPLESRSPGR